MSDVSLEVGGRKYTVACADGQACAAPAVRRRPRLVFWLVAAAALALIALPLYAPLFY